MVRILILDDDEYFGRNLQRSLLTNQMLACEVCVTTDAQSAYAAISQAQHDPFDIFLVDQRLPYGDGIELLDQLNERSPTSDTIVMINMGDTALGVQAYRSGSYSYLVKPFSLDELLYNLLDLHTLREIRRERNWLMVLNTIAEATQHQTPLRDMSKIIVDSGREFGFERARLWLYLPLEDPSLAAPSYADPHPQDRTFVFVGSSESGNTGLSDFTQIQAQPSDSPYFPYAIESREPVLFHGQEYGQSVLVQRFHTAGYAAPEGDWVMLPLWANNRYIGVLALDNHSIRRPVTANHLQILQLFSRQAAAALERAQIYEQEYRARREVEVLAEIGQHISSQAAQVGLPVLLSELRNVLGRLIDVRNCFVALHNENFSRLELLFHVEDNQACPLSDMANDEGLSGYVFTNNQPLLLQNSTEPFRKSRRIKLIGPRAKCWLGVPLQIEKRAIGVIVVQSYQDDLAYSTADQRLLTAVANQVAGAIQTLHLKEEANIFSRRLATLQRSISELMRLAERDEEWLWHTALTVTTAGYGLGFNRAILFLLDGGGLLLQGRMGIGQMTLKEAERAWHQDDQRSWGFDDYLESLEAERIVPTSIDQIVRDMNLAVRYSRAISEAIQRRKRVLVPGNEVALALPAAFVRTFGVTAYAVLPLFVGEKRIGVLIVDNIYTCLPLHDTLLDQLETLLSAVAQVYENRRQREASDKLIDISRDVLAQLSERPLQEILLDLCAAAQVITGADCVVIRPLMDNSSLHTPRYDNERTAAVGLQHSMGLDLRPSLGGLAMHMLHLSEPQMMGDITGAAWPDGQPVDGSVFVQREQVRAFIAVPMNYTGRADPLGIFYLHFRAPQHFRAHDMERARTFAALAGTVMQASRSNSQLRDKSRRRGHELEILRNLLQDALLPTMDRATIAHKLLLAAHDLLDLEPGQVGLVLREWHHSERTSLESKEMRLQYYIDADNVLGVRHGQQLWIGLTGHVFEFGETLHIDDVRDARWAPIFQSRAAELNYGSLLPTRSELDVPIRMEGSHVLGLFNVESPQIAAFANAHRYTLERLASVAALVLDNLNRQKNLWNVLEAAQTVIMASDVTATLRAVVDTVRMVAPQAAVVTTWYREPEQNRLVPGPGYGVLEESYLYAQEEIATTSLANVLNEHTPIWAADTPNEPRLTGRFVYGERIHSTAAFPLRISQENGKDTAVGALFVNYRSPHSFTNEERATLPILAVVAAASLRDALRIEQLRKQGERLQATTQITSAVGTTLSLDDTLEAVLRTLQELFPQAQPCVLTYNARQHMLEFAHASHHFYDVDFPERVAMLPVDGARSIACQVARQAFERHEPVCRNVGDIHDDPFYLEAVQKTRAELCLALLSTKRELLGVLVLESEHYNAFSQDDVALIQGVGPAISIALERAYDNANLRFQSSVAGVTAWVAEMAHDIKREVGFIRNTAYLLQRHPLSQQHPDVQRYIQAISKSAGQLAAYAQTPHTSEAERVPIDSWLRMFAPKATKQDGISFVFALQCQDECVWASVVLLERVMRHLIRNAVEAMQNHGRIILRSVRKTNFVEIEVENSGPPISDEVRQRLFSEQVSNKVPGIGGTGGLGLLFTRWAVEALGGTIDVTSPPKDAVTFRFTLPLASKEPMEISDA